MHYETTTYFHNPERNFNDLPLREKRPREFYRKFLLPIDNHIKRNNPLIGLTPNSLITTLTLEDSKPLRIATENHECFCLFTSKEKEDRFLDSKNKFKGTIERQFEHKIEHLRMRTYQLSEFLLNIATGEKIEPIRVNPVYSPFDDSIIFHEEILFSPYIDKMTGKYLMCSGDNAKALLALNNQDLKRFGVEIVFHCFTKRLLSEDIEAQERDLSNGIDDLNFFIPRTPIKSGSASLYCVILNFENPFLETAFIRNYQTFNKDTDVIFITSNLEIVTENYETISYDPSNIETILRPLIEWQQNKNNKNKDF